MIKIVRWVREHYNKIISSIAFIPAIIAIGFLLLSWLMLKIDFSEGGKHFKSQLSWLSLKDASTGRSIISTIVGGIMSLTVFSFSMVMIVLTQAASQMSNRILSSMIENRFQQVVLGFYIGTIVYALFLLSTIRDINSGIYVPALSIYLLILLTIIDIFLFIYFLDFITQTVKFETVIRRVQEKTLAAMQKKFCADKEETISCNGMPVTKVYADKSDYFQGVDDKQLLQIADKQNIIVSILHPTGTYLVKDSLLLLVYGKENIDKECRNKILLALDFFKGQPVERHAGYGFHQLAEVAIRALSPGINDPATAVLCLHALTDLFTYRLYHCLPSLIKNENGEPRILLATSSFKELFSYCIQPIWEYGKKDKYIQQALLHLLDQLQKADCKNHYAAIFNKLTNQIESQVQKQLLQA